MLGEKKGAVFVLVLLLTNVDSPLQNCGKALNCIDVGGESSALISAGASDGTLRIWDPRRPGL